MTAAITSQGLSAGYPGAPVLRDVSFTVAAGEMVGVLGPNGAGKTTLFRVLTGLLQPAAGAVTLFGRELSGVSALERAGLVGVVPQELETPMAFVVAEIVTMGRTASLNRWRPPSANDMRQVEQAMREADVLHLRDRHFAELSGGEKQRVLIAMVLAQDPKLILLDEATAHLDLSHRLEVLELVERLNRERGVTVVMTSHDLALTAEFSRRLLLLDNGRIAADGTPDSVLQSGMLRAVFRCDVRARRDPETGALAVFPVRVRKP